MFSMVISVIPEVISVISVISGNRVTQYTAGLLAVFRDFFRYLARQQKYLRCVLTSLIFHCKNVGQEKFIQAFHGPKRSTDCRSC